VVTLDEYLNILQKKALEKVVDEILERKNKKKRRKNVPNDCKIPLILLGEQLDA
jgi:hypothetical protein